MKKKFVLALALALTLSLTACNKPESKPAASSPEQSVTESTPEQTPPVESEPEQTKETAPVESVPEQPESVDLFTDTNETVYVTSTVDLLVDPDENSGKIGQLNWGDSVLRTGIGIDDVSGWSEIQLANGSIAYVASEYLTTTNLVEQKPVEQVNPVEKPVEQIKPVEKPASSISIPVSNPMPAPEDLDQNMMIEEDELAAYESGNEEEIMEYMPLEEVLPYTEEELEEIYAEGKEYVESQGGGLAAESNQSGLPEGLLTGDPEVDKLIIEAYEKEGFHPENRPGAVYDPETGGTYDPNCAIN